MTYEVLFKYTNHHEAGKIAYLIINRPNQKQATRAAIDLLETCKYINYEILAIKKGA